LRLSRLSGSSSGADAAERHVTDLHLASAVEPADADTSTIVCWRRHGSIGGVVLAERGLVRDADSHARERHLGANLTRRRNGRDKTEEHEEYNPPDGRTNHDQTRKRLVTVVRRTWLPRVRPPPRQSS
jgi:hypothetical protein